MLKNFCFSVLLAISTAHAQTQLDLNVSACSEFNKVDSELNAVYRQVLAKHKDDLRLTNKLKEAQRAWIKFRDAHVEAVYPAQDKQEYGSVFPMCYCMELASLTEERVAHLKKWLTAEEGDVCSGSRWSGSGD